MVPSVGRRDDRVDHGRMGVPRISGPHEHTQSMYSLPSTSTSVEPSPRAMKIGSRPIARIARTGEFTPPGISSSARR